MTFGLKTPSMSMPLPQPEQSTGSGRFGWGARLPGPPAQAPPEFMQPSPGLQPMPPGMPPPEMMRRYDQLPGTLGAFGQMPPQAQGQPQITQAQPQAWPWWGGQTLGSMGMQAGPWNPAPGRMSSFVRG